MDYEFTKLYKMVALLCNLTQAFYSFVYLFIFRALEVKIAEQQQMQKEIDVINQEHQRQKEIRSEQEKLADQKVIEYMKKRAVSFKL